MRAFDEHEMRELLLNWEVPEPGLELTSATVSLIREEMLRPQLAPAPREKGFFMLVALSVAMSLCLFYILTVGTILRFVLPVYLLDILRHTLFALTAAGGSMLVCTLMMLLCKHFGGRRAEESYGNAGY